MTKQKKSIREQFSPVVRFINTYKKFAFVLGVILAVTFVVYRINQFSSAEPSQSKIDEKLQTVSRPKLDQAVLNRIQQLQDQNVEIKSLFEQNRNNPFNE